MVDNINWYSSFQTSKAMLGFCVISYLREDSPSLGISLGDQWQPPSQDLPTRWRFENNQTSCTDHRSNGDLYISHPLPYLTEASRWNAMLVSREQHSPIFKLKKKEGLSFRSFSWLLDNAAYMYQAYIIWRQWFRFIVQEQGFLQNSPTLY